MLSIGPFSAGVVQFLIALGAAIVGAGWGAHRHASGTARRATSVVADTVLVGLVVARIAFVIAWWSRYMQNPWSVFFISDGGFTLWVGCLGGAAFLAFRLRKHRALWRPAAIGVSAGWITWAVAGGVLMLAGQGGRQLPDAPLARLDGGTVRLAQLANEPVVVNLWATWCPPCRREMPMLAAAEKRYPEVTFVFVNQYEGRPAIRAYLRRENLALEHVLIDTTGAIARHVGSGVLPTTLFYNADGRLVASHVGVLSAATLAATLQRFDLSRPSGGFDNSRQRELATGAPG